MSLEAAVLRTRKARTAFRQGTAKELDEETGLYYYGARYLDPKYSMWLSTDSALGEYIPQAPINDEARRNNANLPGMGGVFNHINGNLYHYAGNNPVKYVDPDGRTTFLFVVHADTPWEIIAGGSHCGLYFSNPANYDKTLYDPSGHFENRCKGSASRGHPQDGIFGAYYNDRTPIPDVRAYLEYHLKIDGQVNVYVFETSPKEEENMIEQAEKNPRPGSMSCASRCSRVLKKIGFKTVSRPGSLENQAKTKIKAIVIKNQKDLDNFIRGYNLELQDYQKPYDENHY